MLMALDIADALLVAPSPDVARCHRRHAYSADEHVMSYGRTHALMAARDDFAADSGRELDALLRAARATSLSFHLMQIKHDAHSDTRPALYRLSHRKPCHRNRQPFVSFASRSISHGKITSHDAIGYCFSRFTKSLCAAYHQWLLIFFLRLSK